MSTKKWLTLLEGTEVRMTCDCGGFTKWDIATRRHRERDDSDSVYFETDDYGCYLLDYEWELIEDKEEIKERLPKQGDKIQVKNEWWPDWSWTIKTFVCFYKGKVIVEDPELGLQPWAECRFYPQEEVTLSDGNTYLVDERDGEKFLILKK